MTPNRRAVYITAALALLGGLAPVVGNLDLASTAGIIASIGVIGAVVVKWLEGWQTYEKASYQLQAMAEQQAATLAQQSAAMEAAKQASGPRKPTIQGLPR